MDTAWIAPVTTLLAALGGYWFAARNEERRDARALERDRIKITDERAQVRNEFQRQTLLELQDAVHRQARLVARTLLFDHEQALKGLYTQMPTGLSDELHVNGQEVIRLRTRVLDDEVRASVEHFEGVATELTMVAVAYRERTPTGDALERMADGYLIRLNEEGGKVMAALGAAIRRHLAK